MRRQLCVSCWKINLWLLLPGPCSCRAHVGLFGWLHWLSHPVPGAGCLSKEDHGSSLPSSLPSLAQPMTTGLGGQRGRTPTTSSVSPPLSTHKEVAKSVFTLSPACIFACISSASCPTQNQLFLGQHHPAFSGSLSGNGVTIHIWVLAVRKQLHSHRSLGITTFSYW